MAKRTGPKKLGGGELPNTPPPAQPKPGSQTATSMVCIPFLPTLAHPNSHSGGPRTLLQEGSGFPGCLLGQTFPGKPTLRIAPDHWAGAAIWMGLIGADRSRSEAGTNGLCGHSLSSVVVLKILYVYFWSKRYWETCGTGQAKWSKVWNAFPTKKGTQSRES